MTSERTDCTLGDLFDLQRGKTYKSKLKGQPGPVLLGLASINRNGGFRRDKLTTYGGDSPDSLLAHPGDLFVSLKDVTQAADLLGSVARVPLDVGVGRLTQDTVKLIPKSDSVPIDYAYWLLRAPQTRDRCRSWATGTTNLGLARDDFLSIRVPPYTLRRQRVTSLLCALEAKIELNRELNRTLEAMAQAIFKSWFIDFDGHDDLAKSELGPIPAGWGVAQLDSQLDVLQTGNRPKGGVRGITEGVPSIGAESITRIAEFDFSKTKRVPYEFFRGMKKGVLQDRDVLVYKDGGKPGDFRPHVSMFGDGFPYPEMAINSHVYRLRTNGALSQEYLYFWLASDDSLAAMRRLGTGAAIPGIPRRNLVAMSVLIPPEPNRKRFDAFAGPVVSRMFGNSNQARTLAELRDTLLPRLISGEIRVSEAEQAVESAS